MLITARTYSASQTPDQGATPSTERTSRYHTLAGWRKDPIDARQAADMLLIHQVGSVRVGEVVRCAHMPRPLAQGLNDLVSTNMTHQVYYHIHPGCRSYPAYSCRPLRPSEEYIGHSVARRLPPWPLHPVCCLLSRTIRPKHQIREARN